MKRVTVIANADVQDRATAFTDPTWQTLRTASTAQIDAWLAANINTVADARRVLRSLIVALRYFMVQEQRRVSGT